MQLWATTAVTANQNPGSAHTARYRVQCTHNSKPIGLRAPPSVLTAAVERVLAGEAEAAA